MVYHMTFLPNNLSSFTGFEIATGVFNEILVAEPKDQISVVFDYGVQQGTPHGTLITTTGDGDVTDSEGLAVISSTSGTAQMRTRDRLTYDAGHTTIGRFTTSATGAGTANAGMFDDDDGFFFTFSGGQLVSVTRRRETVDTTANAIDFNGVDISDLDFTKIHIFYIMFGYLGVGNPSFYVLDSDGNVRLVHQFKTIGNLTTPHVRHPALPIQMETDGAAELRTASIHASIWGRGEFVNRQNFADDVETSVASGATETLANYRVVTDFEYKPGVTTLNKRKARLVATNFFIDKPATGEGVLLFELGIAASVAAPSYSNFSPFQSILEKDTAGTATPARTVLYRNLSYDGGGFLGGGEGGSVDFGALALTLDAYAGDQLFVRVTNRNTTTVTARADINWQEI